MCLYSARLTLHDLKVELAVSLYAQGRPGIGKARELAEMSLWTFRQLLAFRQVPPHYDETDLQKRRRHVEGVKTNMMVASNRHYTRDDLEEDLRFANNEI